MKAKLGSGARFAAVEKSAAASGARNPAAVAAAVGRKKYGNAKFNRLAQAGRSHMQRVQHEAMEREQRGK